MMQLASALLPVGANGSQGQQKLSLGRPLGLFIISHHLLQLYCSRSGALYFTLHNSFLARQQNIKDKWG